MDYSIWTVINKIYHKLVKKSSSIDPLDLLPLDVIQLIYNSLDLASRRRFPAVCRSWRKAYTTIIAAGAPPVKEPPWVLLDVTNSRDTTPTYNLFNISLSTRHKIRFTQRNYNIINTCDNKFLALIFSDEHHYLYNIFSKEHIALPLLDDQGDEQFEVYKIVVSCDPSQRRNIDGRRCMVALAALINNRYTRIYLCELGTVSHWRKLADFDVAINDMTFYQGNLYGINMQLEFMFSFSASTFPSAMNTGLHLFQVQYPKLVCPLHVNYIFVSDSLVESDGELLVVRRLHYYNVSGIMVLYFQVFKFFDEELMVRGEGVGLAKAVQVKDLGERMLFVGASSMSWSLMNVPYQHCSEFYRNNCIYSFYITQNDRIGVARFDVKDNDVCKIVIPISTNYSSTPYNDQPLWIMPLSK